MKFYRVKDSEIMLFITISVSQIVMASMAAFVFGMMQIAPLDVVSTVLWGPICFLSFGVLATFIGEIFLYRSVVNEHRATEAVDEEPFQ